jgi:uroporphyrinogen III methyltransferase / synthase
MSTIENMGMVFLVGAGPGDPKLITLRGKELLERADVVIYDYLANVSLLDFAKMDAERVYVGKKGGSGNSAHQLGINDLMISFAKKGKTVVRLKGGDPFIFGRGGEEVEALATASIPFEVIPGISSAIAVPAYAGIPLTHRDRASSFTVITGHEDPQKSGDFISQARLATGADTLVYLMAMGKLSKIISDLIVQGRSADTPVALIQWGSYPYQRTLVGTLGDIVKRSASEEMKPPVVMVVGDVVSLKERINWFESRALFGKRILVTRAKAQAGTFLDLLRGYGASAISFPTLRIVPPSTWEGVDIAIDHIEQYDAIIFTSVNGVDYFRKRLKTLDQDLRRLKGITLAAIGPRTAKAIRDWGLHVDLIPETYTAEGLLEALRPGGFSGRHFLIPRAEEAREVLPREIKGLGGTVDVAPVYKALQPSCGSEEMSSLMKRGPIDMLTFASSSTLKNFVAMLGPEMMASYFKGSAIACIGPITAKTAKDFGLKVDVMPSDYTFEAMTTAIVDYFVKKK